MAATVTHLPCDDDHEAREPGWTDGVETVTAWIDATTQIKAVERTAKNGATYLDVRFVLAGGTTLNLALTLSAQANMARAITSAVRKVNR